MGTHPIFESDFDCLTDFERIMTAHLDEIQQEKMASTGRYFQNDGWCGSLQIYKPKPTVSEVPAQIKTKWFRDPNTRQWIHIQQVIACIKYSFKNLYMIHK